MWNKFNTGEYTGVVFETTAYSGNNGDLIHANFVRPTGPGPYPGVVLIHHLPGWDDYYREMAFRFAAHGYTVMSPDLYCRVAHGTPDDIGAKIRSEGGMPDDQVVGDLAAAGRFLRALPNSNGKVGIVGTCSGGRHAFLTGARTPGGFDAVIDLWGGGVVMSESELNPKQPVAPIDYTKDLDAPLLGIFGNDDQRPTPAQVDQHEEELKKQGKNYEFHRYDGAGHGFFYYDRPAYRQEQAMDAWGKVWDFFGKHLSG